MVLNSISACSWYSRFTLDGVQLPEGLLNSPFVLCKISPRWEILVWINIESVTIQLVPILPVCRPDGERKGVCSFSSSPLYCLLS